MQRVLHHITHPPVLKRSAKVSLVVGSILNLINQYDFLFGDAEVDILRGFLNYLVPFCVATYGGVTARLEREQDEAGGKA